MLPREVVEELIGGLRATGLHVLVPLANAFNGFLVVLTLPFEVVGQNVVKRISRAPSAAPGESSTSIQSGTISEATRAFDDC